MATGDQGGNGPLPEANTENNAPAAKSSRWAKFFKREKSGGSETLSGAPNVSDEEDNKTVTIEKWSLGILNDKDTDEVPGSVLLMSEPFKRNEPLGLRNAPGRNTPSSLPSPYSPRDDPLAHHTSSRPSTPRQRPSSARPERPVAKRMFSSRSARSKAEEKKKTPDGKIILEPQPEDTLNDPLNWPTWRREIALLSLGFYCAMGGGMSTVVAAAFTDISATYSVPVPTVALTTGFLMCGQGVGSVIASPTAILIGKRPVYIAGAILFIISGVWCALSPNYASLVVARIVMGISISPVECLPSATIAEIFFLHERAYRTGIYTLLLLGGKNLIPLVGAAIGNALGWRWIFWIVAILGFVCLLLLFFFVPETFWDRTPRPKKHERKHHLGSLSHFFSGHHGQEKTKAMAANAHDSRVPESGINLADVEVAGTIAKRRQRASHHVGFSQTTDEHTARTVSPSSSEDTKQEASSLASPTADEKMEAHRSDNASVPTVNAEATDNANSRTHSLGEKAIDLPYFMSDVDHSQVRDVESTTYVDRPSSADNASGPTTPAASSLNHTYTQHLRHAPPKSYADTLLLWNGRLRPENWFKVAVRPFILYAYPAILWSALVYALSVGWLIVISESLATVYRNRDTYNFTALQTGLVYLAPFIGGCLGSAVAGKVSDILVRFMARRNNGIYEPEFRLVMAIPILVATSFGLMGYGWSVAERDNFMVPTIMFGVTGFGCSLGSTTAITFAVDSYRQYAGEALVTLNFSKNIFHGLVFSLFFPQWFEAKGSKQVFVVLGSVHVACLLTTIPLYIYGKRARMWTVRKNLMERF